MSLKWLRHPGFWLVGALLWLGMPLPQRLGPPVERAFRVEARQFAFSPAVLRVNPGDRVTIELHAMDVAHGLEVDGYGVEIQATPGQPAHLTFVADRPGTFRLRCSVTCGDLHPFMLGQLQVGGNPWLWRGLGLLAWALLAGWVMARAEAAGGRTE